MCLGECGASRDDLWRLIWATTSIPSRVFVFVFGNVVAVEQHDARNHLTEDGRRRLADGAAEGRPCNETAGSLLTSAQSAEVFGGLGAGVGEQLEDTAASGLAIAFKVQRDSGLIPVCLRAGKEREVHFLLGGGCAYNIVDKCGAGC